MGVGGIGGGGGFNPIQNLSNPVSNIPIVGDIAKAASGGSVSAGDVFKKILDPLGIGDAIAGLFGGNKTMMSGQADQIANDVFSKASERQAYNNYDSKGRDEATSKASEALGKEVSDWMMQRIQSGSTPSQEEIDAFMGPKAAAVEQQVNAQFGPPPKNPDAFPAPNPAYDWKGRDKAMQDASKPLADQLAQMAMNGAPQEQIDAFAKQEGARIDAQINAQFGTPPEILEGSPKDPNYDYDRQAAVTERVTKEFSDQLTNMINSGASPEEIQRFADSQGDQLQARIDAECGVPNPPPAYNPDKDTPEVYAQNRYQMEQQIEGMKDSGADQSKILAYKVQRQAELAELFPKQTMLNDTKDEWKAVAVAMQANGKSEGDIKDYLKKKEDAWKDPSPEELQVYSARKASEAQEIQALLASKN
jgi:hypothetical protein